MKVCYYLLFRQASFESLGCLQTYTLGLNLGLVFCVFVFFFCQRESLYQVVSHFEWCYHTTGFVYFHSFFPSYKPYILLSCKVNFSLKCFFFHPFAFPS